MFKLWNSTDLVISIWNGDHVNVDQTVQVNCIDFGLKVQELLNLSSALGYSGMDYSA